MDTIGSGNFAFSNFERMSEFSALDSPNGSQPLEEGLEQPQHQHQHQQALDHEPLHQKIGTDEQISSLSNCGLDSSTIEMLLDRSRKLEVEKQIIALHKIIKAVETGFHR